MPIRRRGWPGTTDHHGSRPLRAGRTARHYRRTGLLLAPSLALCLMAASPAACRQTRPISCPIPRLPQPIPAAHRRIRPLGMPLIRPHTPAPSAGRTAEDCGASAIPVVHHHAAPRPSATPIPNLVFEVEPAEARVPLRNDAIAYLQPSKKSPQVEHLQAGKLVHVTGATRYFLQLKLKEGSTAYVLADDALLTVPADKIFRLTADTPVLARPNKWAKQLAEVHQGHDVHVVGVALNYMRIQDEERAGRLYQDSRPRIATSRQRFRRWCAACVRAGQLLIRKSPARWRQKSNRPRAGRSR